MSLLSVVQDVCEVVGVERLPSVFSNLNIARTQQEMLTCANEAAQSTAYDTRDWTDLIVTTTMTGDGVVTSFPLPADYHRMLVDSNVWTSLSALVPLRFINSYDQWLRRAANSYWDNRGQYIIIGGKLLIQPALANGATATFAYLSKNIINLTSGGRGVEFTADTDSYVLAERLLKLCMIYKWKKNKGSPYAEDMGDYYDALTMKMGHDQPAPILVGSAPMSTQINATVAYPWPLPSP